MATSAQSQNDPNQMRRYPNYVVSDEIRARLPPANIPPSQPPPPLNPPLAQKPAPLPAGRGRAWWNSGFFPVFWTIASILSIGLNLVLCLFVLGLLSMRGPITQTVTGQSTSLLGGLYGNFVKMDQATITRTVPVDAVIPINLDSVVVPVDTMTTIQVQPGQRACLSKVDIRTGGLTLLAPGCITFANDRETPLNVKLKLDIPLKNVSLNVPIHLDVPVSIPLRETELHQPFVGLQEVVKPLLCFIQPSAVLANDQTCPPRSFKFLGNSTP